MALNQPTNNPGTHALTGDQSFANGHSRYLLPSILPPGESLILKHSSFFSRNPSTTTLPSPAEVRAEASRQNPNGSKSKFRPPPVHYPSLGLTVKYGGNVHVSEGQCLWAIKHLFGDVIPVPEVYGWTTDQRAGFVYMEYIEGETLEKRWDSLSEPERLDICSQLRLMVARLRDLKQAPGDVFIGNIARQPLLDIVFTDSCSPPVGPLPSVKAFHDLFVKLPFPDEFKPDDPPHPLRHHLPDDVSVVFTHGDLHRSNIMISPSAEGSSPRIASIIDWHQSGWYPSYWEYCKARWTTRIGEEWEVKYLPLFLDKHDGYNYWDYFNLKMGV